MQQERLALIREFTEQQRQATRLAMTDGITRGLNPIDQARAFRNSIGLTQRQQASVINYRRLLEQASLGDGEALTRSLRDRRFDPTIRRAIRTGEPLSQAQIDRMVERYGDRSVKYRAEVIGRTEAQRAVHAGQDEAIRQAVEDGPIEPPEVRREWISARDGRVRDSHADLNGVVRGLDETFPGRDGALRFPGDPWAPPSETIQCRCSLAMLVEIPEQEYLEAA